MARSDLICWLPDALLAMGQVHVVLEVCGDGLIHWLCLLPSPSAVRCFSPTLYLLFELAMIRFASTLLATVMCSQEIADAVEFMVACRSAGILAARLLSFVAFRLKDKAALSAQFCRSKTLPHQCSYRPLRCTRKYFFFVVGHSA